ncbi:MAG: hypothetical protein ACREUZ_07720 [Burkholderiales bacterium]
MNRRLVAGALVVGGALVAMVVGPNGPIGSTFWPATELDSEPGAAQLAGLMGAGIIEALGFGLGLAVLFLGRSLFERVTSTSAKATTAQLCGAWLVGSWWLHSSLHLHFGLQPGPLVFIEWLFHAGSIVAAVLLASAVLTSLPVREPTEAHK